MKEKITVICLKKTTREQLKDFGKKGDTYDDIINKLMSKIEMRKRKDEYTSI